MIDFTRMNIEYGGQCYARTGLSKRCSQKTYTSFTSNPENNNNDNNSRDINLLDAVVGLGTLLVGGTIYLLSKCKKGRNILNKLSEVFESKVKSVEPNIKPKHANEVIEDIPEDIVEELVDGKWVPYYRKK